MSANPAPARASTGLCTVVSMLKACYWHAMGNIQVKGVPEDLHRRVRRRAKLEGRTIRDLVLEAIRRQLEREDFRHRLARRAPVDLGRPAATTLEEVRTERERDLGGA